MSEAIDQDPGLDPTYLILIVVGAHLRAEQADRPLAYHLERRIKLWIRKHADVLNVPLRPLICSDIWYLNHEVLQQRPTIALGGPGVNGLSAYFAQQLPQVDPTQQQIVIQIDPEFTDLRVCLWGTDHALTKRGINLFVDRYLEGFLTAAATQVEPREE